MYNLSVHNYLFQQKLALETNRWKNVTALIIKILNGCIYFKLNNFIRVFYNKTEILLFIID